MDDPLAVLLESLGKGSIPSLVIVRDDTGKVVAQGEEVQVHVGGGHQMLALPPVRQLFRGDRRAPDLSDGPTSELNPFFMLLEHTVVRFCEADGRDETDQEMERIFASLRRRPDSDGGRLRGYLRAAARLHLSAHEVSQAEYDAVMNRLTKSARTFSIPPVSRNYLWTLKQTFASMTA